MSVQSGVPDIVVSRLPLYLRTLKQLQRAGVQLVSSKQLGEILDLTPAQIRKDLSWFGEFGRQGKGYEIPYLISQLERILHVDRVWEMIVVGAGALGLALLHYPEFEINGFRIVALYDNDPAKIGQHLGGFIVRDVRQMPEDVRRHGWRIGVIAVPENAAQEVADRMVEAGIQALLCYAPIILALPPHIQVQYIDPIVHLQHMTYYLSDTSTTRPAE